MLEKLVECLRALAAPADFQLKRFPDFVCKADELALDYADALLLASACQQFQLTGEQQAALRAVDDLLADMSGEGNAQLWTDLALREAVEWGSVRRAAADALLKLDQPFLPPRVSDSIYIPGTGDRNTGVPGGWRDVNELRIYADFNGLCSSSRTADRLAVPLDTLGTVRDLSNAGVRLRAGLRLTVYDWSDDDKDLEADSTSYYDSARRRWVAELDTTGYRHVPKTDRSPVRHFLCVNCRENIDVDENGFPNLSACLNCGAAVQASVAPPEP